MLSDDIYDIINLHPIDDLNFIILILWVTAPGIY
jgi:hypothetical protein